MAVVSSDLRRPRCFQEAHGHPSWWVEISKEKGRGIAFSRAQYAFADRRRVIAKDVNHSQSEVRFSCFGLVDGGVLTVRFSLSALRTFQALAPVSGAKERQSMSAKIKYADGTLGKIEVLSDFLPSPAELAFREEGVESPWL